MVIQLCGVSLEVVSIIHRIRIRGSPFPAFSCSDFTYLYLPGYPFTSPPDRKPVFCFYSLINLQFFRTGHPFGAKHQEKITDFLQTFQTAGPLSPSCSVFHPCITGVVSSGAVFCITGCLGWSSASAYYIPVPHPSCDSQNVSRHLCMFPDSLFSPRFWDSSPFSA